MCCFYFLPKGRTGLTKKPTKLLNFKVIFEPKRQKNLITSSMPADQYNLSPMDKITMAIPGCFFPYFFVDNHVCMVHRMIGSKAGTGGSSGYQYLRSTVRYCMM